MHTLSFIPFPLSKRPASLTFVRALQRQLMGVYGTLALPQGEPVTLPARYVARERPRVHIRHDHVIM